MRWLASTFMTEKQGGSDVRSNLMRARPAEGGADGFWRLVGHKYFCSAPMSDAFLTLARTDAGISCFLLPRWTPDGERNALSIQHLKDKLGNRSNASVEIELEDAWAVMVGEDGRGIRTIVDMVQGNRLYCAVSSAAIMREGLAQALHHTRHRSAFQRRLADQPLMRHVLADLALEAEAARALGLRTARAVDEAGADPQARAFARIATAVAKYWVCKRAPGHAFEALECHGGPGYVEDGPMAWLYREALLNSIWEGSGNVLCLDVLRAMAREEGAAPAVLAEIDAARGGHPALDGAAAALLVRHAPVAVADAFCASRLGARWTGAYGTLPPTPTPKPSSLAPCRRSSGRLPGFPRESKRPGMFVLRKLLGRSCRPGPRAGAQRRPPDPVRPRQAGPGLSRCAPPGRRRGRCAGRR